MARISMVMFDLSGTTVYDEGYVTRCLFQAAQELGIDATEEFIGRSIGTNKRHLYQFLIARSRGVSAGLERLGDANSPAMRLDAESLDLADRAFRRYEELMIEVYCKETREVPGAEDTFRWLHERNIAVATDTGFHRSITEAIFERLRWLKNGLVDVSIDVQDIPGERGRPAPYMIFHAMERLGITSVQEVVKVGDQPSDLLEGNNAGCAGVIGVLSGSASAEILGSYRHTHLIPSVAELSELFEREFGV